MFRLRNIELKGAKHIVDVSAVVLAEHAKTLLYIAHWYSVTLLWSLSGDSFGVGKTEKLVAVEIIFYPGLKPQAVLLKRFLTGFLPFFLTSLPYDDYFLIPKQIHRNYALA